MASTTPDDLISRVLSGSPLRNNSDDRFSSKRLRASASLNGSPLPDFIRALGKISFFYLSGSFFSSILLLESTESLPNVDDMPSSILRSYAYQTDPTETASTLETFKSTIAAMSTTDIITHKLLQHATALSLADVFEIILVRCSLFDNFLRCNYFVDSPRDAALRGDAARAHGGNALGSARRPARDPLRGPQGARAH